jgi:nucleotide-binding universal stress UspA family protein
MGATEAAQKAEELFYEKTAQAGISAEWLFADWSVVGVSVTEILNMFAYYSDLVIIGQPNHSSADPSNPLDLPERLGLGAGRPLLVVPYAGDYSSIGNRVMIAWKAGREAVRSVNDALPILEKAGHVSVVTISPADRPDSSDTENALKICSHLGRHAVNATHEHIYASSGMTIGDVLLNHACEQKMDLLIMGAYAQSRRGVFLHSPVTRHLLNFLTVPLLISH